MAISLKSVYKPNTQKALLALPLVLIPLVLIYVFASTPEPKETVKGAVSISITSICFDLNTDQEVVDQVELWANGLEEYRVSTETCDIQIARNIRDINEFNKLAENNYLLVTHELNAIEDITGSELAAALEIGEYGQYQVGWSNQTDSFIRTKHDIGVGQQVYPPEALKNKLAADQFLAVIKPSEYQTEYKIVTIDGYNPLEETPPLYPLRDTYWINGSDEELEKKVVELLALDSPPTLTTVLLTGSSTIGARSQLIKMQMEGSTYPVQKISSLLKSADITQISNESSFIDSCTQSTYTNLLCSTPEAINMLVDSGVDVVGVTGNHILDYGRPAFVNTLTQYSNANMKYYGGGTSSTAARIPAIVERDNVKFAFLGYNFNYPFSYYSTSKSAGSANVSMEIMKEDIAKAKEMADIVFVEMQWGAARSQTPVAYQIEYGRAAIDYGANVVFGVNTHNIQGVEEYSGGHIYYSLGNFLTDDITVPFDRQGIALKLYYNGTELYDIEPIPIYISADSQVELAESELKATIVKRLYDLSNNLIEQ